MYRTRNYPFDPQVRRLAAARRAHRRQQTLSRLLSFVSGTAVTRAARSS